MGARKPLEKNRPLAVAPLSVPPSRNMPQLDGSFLLLEWNDTQTQHRRGTDAKG